MPTSPRSPCSEQRCPGFAVHRGRCEAHRQSEEQRGYGNEWRRVRAAVRREQGRCAGCGSASDLTVDHRIPQSMGGTNARANLRTLCRKCHAEVGMKATSR